LSGQACRERRLPEQVRDSDESCQGRVPESRTCPGRHTGGAGSPNKFGTPSRDRAVFRSPGLVRAGSQGAQAPRTSSGVRRWVPTGPYSGVPDLSGQAYRERRLPEQVRDSDESRQGRIPESRTCPGSIQGAKAPRTSSGLRQVVTGLYSGAPDLSGQACRERRLPEQVRDSDES